MKEPGQRWLILPFSLGCASRSSVAAATSTPTGMNRRSHESKSSSIVKKSKYSIGFSLPKPNLSLGIRKLIKHLKSVSQIFGYRDDEEQEAELEIGYPTDVKHLTHIGWDGSTTIPNQHDKGTVNSFPSISLKQFELAMAAQAQGIVTHQ